MRNGWQAFKKAEPGLKLVKTSFYRIALLRLESGSTNKNALISALRSELRL